MYETERQQEREVDCMSSELEMGGLICHYLLASSPSITQHEACYRVKGGSRFTPRPLNTAWRLSYCSSTQPFRVG